MEQQQPSGHRPEGFCCFIMVRHDACHYCEVAERSARRMLEPEFRGEMIKRFCAWYDLEGANIMHQALHILDEFLPLMTAQLLSLIHI